MKRTRMKARNAKRGGSRFPKHVLPSFRSWVAEHDCCVCGALGPSHAHHVKTKGSGGPDRDNLTPLCGGCHDELHRTGRQTFARTHGVDLGAKARAYWAAYLDEYPDAASRDEGDRG